MSNPFSAKPGKDRPEPSLKKDLPEKMVDQPTSDAPDLPAVGPVKAEPEKQNESEMQPTSPVESKPLHEPPEEVSPAKTEPSTPTQTESTPQAKTPPPAALGMDEVSCRTCRFLCFEGNSRISAHEGECRRNAPSPGANQVASWPRVTWEGWCGEWESGVSDEDMVKMARAIADRQADGPSGGFVRKVNDDD